VVMWPNDPKLSHGCGKSLITPESGYNTDMKKNTQQNKGTADVGSSTVLGHMVKNRTYHTIIKDSSGEVLNDFKSINPNKPFLTTFAIVNTIFDDYPLNETLYLEISSSDSDLSTPST
jgi:hypothetical protein